MEDACQVKFAYFALHLHRPLTPPRDAEASAPASQVNIWESSSFIDCIAFAISFAPSGELSIDGNKNIAMKSVQQKNKERNNIEDSFSCSSRKTEAVEQYKRMVLCSLEH